MADRPKKQQQSKTPSPPAEASIRPFYCGEGGGPQLTMTVGEGRGEGGHKLTMTVGGGWLISRALLSRQFTTITFGNIFLVDVEERDKTLRLSAGRQFSGHPPGRLAGDTSLSSSRRQAFQIYNCNYISINLAYSASLGC